MTSGPGVPQPTPPRSNTRPGFEHVVLRLIKGGPERLAIAAGEIDAIIDTASGRAILLPDAQQALAEREEHFRSLVALCADWHWEQDAHHRCTACSGTAAGLAEARLIGKTLWELPFDNMTAADWQTHRTQIGWHAPFRDLELRYTDPTGAVHWISLAGEPVYDGQDRYTGYRGIARDISARREMEVLLRGSDHHALATFDALATPTGVLDATGSVILANPAWCTDTDCDDGIGMPLREGADYLAACDNAPGPEHADGSAIAAGIRRVIAGETGLFRHEFSCRTPTRQRWFVLTVTDCPGDGAVRVVVSREDITERKQAEQKAGLDYTATVRANVTDREPAIPITVANDLLAAMPHADYQQLLTALEPVTLTRGDELHAPGARIQHAYFPIDCMVSLQAPGEGFRALDVGRVGHEGMVGIPLALGIDTSPVRALVQWSGTAMRIEAAALRRELLFNMPLQLLLQRYAHALMIQFAQAATCHNFHALPARLAHGLLMIRDCVLSDEFRLTQSLLGEMLGVRRVGITAAAGILQKNRLIRYSRGRITIVDGRGLEAAACPCYRILKDPPR